ncbi:hypothetical protein [Streptomyces sp. NPDC092952]|uniref:hypothetical protein n=1 Tax=Streptomyces sp. NPDC092952 TaxID=3366018 RepID=UPI00380CF63B
MNPSLLGLAVPLGASLSHVFRTDGRLARTPCSTTCSTTRRAENGEDRMNHTNQPRARSRRGRTLAREAARDQRREALLVLLGRADRGALTRADARHLRDLAAAEVDECDAFRRAAGGQQAAALGLRHRIEAAEQAIREVEAERDRYAAEAETRRMAAGRGA